MTRNYFMKQSFRSELAVAAYCVLRFALIVFAGALVPGISVAGDTTEERIGRGKISSSFHYFTDVEYSYREVGLERGGWDFHKAGLKDFTARFGIRHSPQFMRRFLKPEFTGGMEYFFSVTGEELRKERRLKTACWTTTDIIHTGLSPLLGLGIGVSTWGPGRSSLHTRIEVRYGEYKGVSSSRRFDGNEYDVQADISVEVLIVDMEWRYRLGIFEPFLAYSIYNFSLDRSIIYPSPTVGTNGDYVDVSANTHGLAIGTWIKLKPDINMRLARHFFNQDAYTIQTEMRF